MTKTQFVLTYRDEDLRELYKDTLNYRLFSKVNYPTLFLIFFFVFLAAISIINISNTNEYLFLSLCFVLGVGYQITVIWKSYLEAKKGMTETEVWLETMRKYKSHKIEFGDTFFRYVRDNDVYTYEVREVKTTYRTDNYFYFMSLNKDSIILPKKAFLNDEFDEFLLLFDEKSK